MIILRSIHLENFMCIDSLDLSFEDNTIISIYGQNGSGKSTLIYAIALCITGYRYGESYRDYVRAGEDSALIILDAELKGEPIHFNIELKGNNKSGNPMKREVTYKGITYLNSDYNQFMKDNELDYIENLMFLFQGNNDLINSKPSERAASLRRLFNFEFNDIVNQLKSKQEQSKLSSYESSVIIDELKGRTYNIQPLSRENTEQQIKSWENSIDIINKDLSKIENIYINNYTDDIKSHKESIRKINNDIERFSDEKEEIEKSIEFNKEIVNTIELIDIAELEKEEDSYRSSINNLNKEIAIIDSNIKELEDQIKVGSSGICHSCGQPVDKNHVVKLKRDLKIKSDKYEKLCEERTEITRKFNKISSDLSKARTAKNQYDKASNSLISLEKRFNDILSVLEDKTSLLDNFKNDLIQLEEKQKEASNLLLLSEKRNELEKEKEEFNKKLITAREIIVSNKERRKSNEVILEAKKEDERRLDELNLKINNLSSQMNITKQSIDIFENQFPNYILLRACGQLENYINSITNIAFEGFKVRLNQSRGGVSFFYKTGEMSDSDEWLPVCLASGAQRTILSLAYTIALGKMYGLNCILLDEVDSACSPETSETIYKFISNLEGFNQIIFISHSEKTREVIKESNKDNILYYKVENGIYERVMED